MISLTGIEELPGPLSPEGIARSTVAGAPLSADELNRIDAFWRACKYLALEARTPKKNSAIAGPHADFMLTITGSTVLRLAVGSGLTTSND